MLEGLDPPLSSSGARADPAFHGSIGVFRFAISRRLRDSDRFRLWFGELQELDSALLRFSIACFQDALTV